MLTNNEWNNVVYMLWRNVNSAENIGSLSQPMTAQWKSECRFEIISVSAYLDSPTSKIKVIFTITNLQNFEKKLHIVH